MGGVCKTIIGVQLWCAAENGNNEKNNNVWCPIEKSRNLALILQQRNMHFQQILILFQVQMHQQIKNMHL